MTGSWITHRLGVVGLLCLVSGCAMSSRHAGMKGAEGLPDPRLVKFEPAAFARPNLETRILGARGGGGVFDPGPPRVQTPSSDLLSFTGATNLSVSAWFVCHALPPAGQTLAGLVGRFNPADSADSEWMLGVRADGRVTLQTTGAGEIASPSAISTGTWIHVGGSWETDGTATLFVNGVQAASGTLALPTGGSLPVTLGDLAPGNGAYALNGELDEVKIWRRAMTLSRAQSLYSAAPDSDSDGIIDGNDPDDNNDGIPDDWAYENFGNSLAGDPDGDADLDGFTNEEEFISGSDPKDAASSFIVSRVGANDHVSDPARRNVFVEFYGLPGRVYTMDFNTSLMSENWQTVMVLTNTVEGTVMVDFPHSLSFTGGFFRVGVGLAP